MRTNTCNPMVFFRGLVSGLLVAATVSMSPAVAQERATVLISDTHMGIGKEADGTWHPFEDFRWPVALQGFLEDVATRHGNAVDLVILGDVFEMWQFPSEFSCPSNDENLGCSPDKLEQLLELILDQHPDEVRALASFATGTGNTVTIVPGNHDASLLLPGVWKKFIDSLPIAARDNFHLASDGHWRSSDGVIYAEHGHQIGKDVNAFADWPNVLRQSGGGSYVVKSWGENAVQNIFNEEERNYEIIDNIGPESEGLKLKLHADGLALTTVDVAKLILFNLFETSRRQKADLFGPPDENSEPMWDLDMAKSKGHRLIAAAYPPDDPFRNLMESDTSEGEELRAELDGLVLGMDDTAIRQACDIAAMNGQFGMCRDPNLGSLMQKLFDSKGAVLTKHIGGLVATPGSGALRIYVYGHTHRFERPREIDVGKGRYVNASNTGAFQRVVTKAKLEQITRGIDRSQILGRVKLHNLPACYSFIEVVDGVPEMHWWFQAEESSTGERLVDTDPRCSDPIQPN